MADKLRKRAMATTRGAEWGGVKAKGRVGNETSDVIRNQMEHFHIDLWLTLALVNWIFDFGRPIAAWYVPVEWTPLNMPSIGDYFHMAYNVIVPFCLLKLQERSPHKLSPNVTYLAVITFVMGASMHLVGDSVNHRLTHVGYLQHVSVVDNPIMKELKPPELVSMFELLYTYDEEIGHLMWYIPFFFTLYIYYLGCFQMNSRDRKLGLGWWILLTLSSVYYWYLVTEGQIFSVYFLTLVAMVVTLVYKMSCGERPDVNGLFLLHTFNVTLVLVLVWVWYWWEDPDLRKKYPAWLYIPEPWSVYSLHGL